MRILTRRRCSSRETEGSTPFRFSLHVGDVGHTLIVGPTGAGKSVLLALMALQFRRYEHSRKSSSSISADRRARRRSPWAATGTISAARCQDDAIDPVSLQPLAPHRSMSAERGWAAEWIAAILARENVGVTPEVKEHLWSALALSRVGAGCRAHAHRPLGPSAIQRPQTRAQTLLPWRTAWTAARRRGRGSGRRRHPDVSRPKG